MIISRVVQITPKAMNRDQHPLARRHEGSSDVPLHSTATCWCRVHSVFRQLQRCKLIACMRQQLSTVVCHALGVCC